MIILGQFSIFLRKNICCGYSLELPERGVSNELSQHMFLLRTGENYPLIITRYPLYLFHCTVTTVHDGTLLDVAGP